MLAELRAHPALRWFLVAGGIVLGFILAVHFFSKKSSATATAADGTAPTPTSVSNKTILINGYPPSQQPAAGGSSGGTVAPPTVQGPPITRPPVPTRPTLPGAPQVPSKPTIPTTGTGAPLQGQPIMRPILAAPQTPVRAGVPPVTAVAAQKVTMASPAQVQANMAVSAQRVAAADAKVNPAPAKVLTYVKPTPKPATPVITAVRSASAAVKNQVATVNARLARAGAA